MKTFSIQSRVSSFAFAFKGLRQFFRQEPNAWLHLLATILVLAAACWFRVSVREGIALTVVTGMVWAAEIFNTAIENIVDLVSPGWHSHAGLIKDLSAAAVLVSAITALITGALIFIPKIC